MKSNPSHMTKETSKEDRRGLKSLFGGLTSAPISSGSFWLLLGASSWFALDSLSAWSFRLYEASVDAFINLPVLDQFAVVTAVAVFALGFAATVREFRTDFQERWAARIVGAAGVLFLVAFAYRMTVQVDRLQNQLAGRESSDSETSAVAHQISVVPSPKVYSVRTEGGIEISWPGTDGGVRPLSTPDRRGCFDHGATFAIDRTTSASGLRLGAVSAEQSSPSPGAFE